MSTVYLNEVVNKFCYFDENENMIDITEKCPVKLYILFKTMFPTKNVFPERLHQAEDIYYILIEQLLTSGSRFEPYPISNDVADNLISAFNKIFLREISNTVGVEFTNVSYI